MPYLRCIEEEEAKYILREVYGDHIVPRSLVSKIIKAGYYWPTLQKDTKEYVEKCNKCQSFENVQRIPRERMTVITSPWPFT